MRTTVERRDSRLKHLRRRVDPVRLSQVNIEYYLSTDMNRLRLYECMWTRNNHVIHKINCRDIDDIVVAGTAY